MTGDVEDVGDGNLTMTMVKVRVRVNGKSYN